MKIRSLHVRLMLMFMVVVMVAISAFIIFTSWLISDVLQNYVNTEQTSDQRLITHIQDTYRQAYSTQQVQALVERIAPQIGTRIIVVDHNQVIIADSARKLVGQTLTASLFLALDNNPSGNPICPPFCHDHSATASVRIISTDGKIVIFGEPLAQVKSEVLDSARHALILTVLVAGLVALILTLTLSGTILQPVRALTLAARRMEQGDLSQRVKVKKRDEIGDLAHAFNTMADSLELSGQLQRKLVSDVAHELRTPLTNIRGYLEALQDEVIEPAPTVIASLYEEAMLLSRLVTDLQDLTLAEAGQLHLQCAPIALEDVITNAINGLFPQARSKDLSVCVDVPAVLPLVEADPQRVGQILRNLLSNAIKHTPSDGEIRVSARPLQQEVEVCVQDTGVGIAAEHLPYLFKRFYRADPSRARATGGTGLGLAIVEQLVHAHGGHVTVESGVERGTRFTFTLPMALT